MAIYREKIKKNGQNESKMAKFGKKWPKLGIFIEFFYIFSKFNNFAKKQV